MRRIIALGGGEIKTKQTLEIDREIAKIIKEKVSPLRGNALFVGTASHDSMPYNNSFRKTYTSECDIKCDVALMVYGEMSMDKIIAKVEKADMIYVGGGDTVYMLEKWKENGFLDILKNAYQNEKIIAGLSAGAIYHFEKMYSDSEVSDGKYALYDGLDTLKGCMCPHYDLRVQDFDEAIIKNNIPFAYAVENNAAIEFIDEKFSRSYSCGGNAWYIENKNCELIKTKL